MEDIRLITHNSKIIALFVHFSFISILFNCALVSPYDNITMIIGLIYCTSTLVFFAAKYKKELQSSIQNSTKYILITTLLGFAAGGLFYKSSFGETLEFYSLTGYFEKNKGLIGDTYYESYQQNIRDIQKLRDLRQAINEDLDI